jgi:hypothetical protein
MKKGNPTRGGVGFLFFYDSTLQFNFFELKLIHMRM